MAVRELEFEEMPSAAQGEVILEVEDLHTQFDTEAGTVKAVDGVSFRLRAGEVLAVVGESGCGKTVTALSVLGLLPKRQGRVTGGKVLFHGVDLTSLSTRKLNRIRGDKIAMIFQDALTALNPVHRVGKQIAEMIHAHRDVSKQAAKERSIELLETVGIPNARERADSYVHQLSGGMRQRAMIAMAIALEPEVLIADEPTTALDVTVQAEVLDVMNRIRERMGMAIILITHDLGVVARMSDRVMVMYAGRNIETGTADLIYHRPKHPYTWGLLQSMPRVDQVLGERLYQIKGAPPSLIDPPEGCRFAPRCAYAQPLCEAEYPPFLDVQGAQVACHFADRDDWDLEITPTELRSRLIEEGKA